MKYTEQRHFNAKKTEEHYAPIAADAVTQSNMKTNQLILHRLLSLEVIFNILQDGLLPEKAMRSVLTSKKSKSALIAKLQYLANGMKIR